MKNSYSIVLTTAATKADAKKIATALVNARLAACIQVSGPITSTYPWKGKVETSEEWLCLMKTTRDRVQSLIKRLQKIHPYDTPEIVALPLHAGSRKYFKWMRSELNAQ